MDLGFYSGKKVLLTGATGFKGSWLAIILKKLGAEVYDYSLEPKTDDDNFVRCNLKNKINSYYGDIRNLDEFQDYINFVKPEIIFHLAAQSLVIKSYSQHIFTYETNLIGTVNLIEIIRRLNTVKQAIFITTDKVYSNLGNNKAFNENDPLGGIDPYSASKACAEIAIQSAIRSFFSEPSTCNIASARAGNVIGAGDWAENRIVPDIYRAIQNNSTLKLRNPNAIRPWQHVLESLFGYLALAIKLSTQDTVYQSAWNFGPESNRDYTVNDLILEIQKHLSFKYEYQNDTHIHEAKTLKLDINKSKSLLNWSPILSFEDTIKFTTDGYKADLEPKTEEEIYQSRIKQITEYMERMNAN
jgi:CDP-glucose 4,6-dehydratase